MMTITEKVRQALLRGESVVIPDFATKAGCRRDNVRKALNRLGPAVSQKVVRGKRGSATKVYTAKDLQALAEWKPGTTAAKFGADSFQALTEVFRMRVVKIKLPTHRHIMEGEWA